MATASENGSGEIVLYALQTCSHCKEAKSWLRARRLPFRLIYVDRLSGEERNDTMRHLRRINPSLSFPTLQVGAVTIVGFRLDALEAALAKLPEG